MKERTTIAIEHKTLERLRALGRKGETYEEILDKLIKLYLKSKGDNYE